jgi:polysaccharide biosynthesis transport protein
MPLNSEAAGSSQSTPSFVAAPTPAERLREYLKIVRRRWVVLVAVTGLSMAAALVLSLSQAKEYDATVKLLFRSEEPINALLGQSSSADDPERQTNTEIGLIKLETVGARARRSLGIDMSTSDLLDSITTEPEGNSDLVAVTARNSNPRRAAAISNAVAAEYVKFRRQSARGSLEEAATLARNQLDSLSPEDQASTEGRALQARLRELEIASSLQTGGVQIVRRAAIPISPAAPRPLFSTVLGGFAGLVLALLVSIGLEFADRRIRDGEDAQATIPLPVLAQIPRPARGMARGAAPRDRLQEEGYAALAANLLHSGARGSVRSLMITSPTAGDGKTTVTLGLARALAIGGQRVIAIEADLRHPRFAQRTGIREGVGFGGILAGAGVLEEQLVHIEAFSMLPHEGLPTSGEPTFRVLPAGPLITPPEGLFSGPELARVIEQCQADADVVILDTPPIGIVHDAINFVNLIDATVMVVRLHWTNKDSAREALRTLGQLQARILGAVFVGTTRPEGYYGAGLAGTSRLFAAAEQQAVNEANR